MTYFKSCNNAQGVKASTEFLEIYAARFLWQSYLMTA